MPLVSGGRSLDARSPVVEIVLAGLDVLVYPLGDAHEGLLDVLAALGARLDVLHDAVALRPLLGLLPGDLALVPLLPRQVRLVADEDDHYVGLGDLPQVAQPVGDVLEGLLAGEVEDEEGAAGAAKVRPRDRLVRLLAGRVPEAELHVLLGGVPRGFRQAGVVVLIGGGLRVRRADGDDAGAELNADGDVVMGGEAALAQADGQAGLAASRVADADEFGDVVPRRRGHLVGMLSV